MYIYINFSKLQVTKKATSVIKGGNGYNHTKCCSIKN